MKIKQFQFNDISVNTYVVWDSQTLDAVIIDPGCYYPQEEQTLKQFVEELHINLPVEFVENPDYNKTNNIYSLALAKEYLCQEDTLLFESDLIFSDELIDAVEIKYNLLLVLTVLP